MLTPRQLEEIRMRRDRVRGVLADKERPDAGFISASARDVPALLDEIERLGNDLADCWVLLDQIARAPQRGSLGEAAERLLRRQFVPGWKGYT